MTRFAWRCLSAVPDLHIEPGDVLVYQPANRQYPFMVCRSVTVSPGAIMGAEHAGEIVPFHLPGDSAEPSPTECRVLPFPRHPTTDPLTLVP